ncbi:MAG: ABC transporter substrate-binding protein [Bacteroides sp.]|jgi:peptide/nickel transport system substrate-binding protein|nr:ABC transporter substrate-binding protein [Bacteroides sp.]
MEYLCRHSLLFLLFLLIFASCSRSPAEKEDGMVFRYNEAANITSLDPLYARNQANIWATSQLFNGLLQLDENLNIKPAIAKSYRVSPDGLIYTFSLNGDVFFHNNVCFPEGKGRKVVAADFVYSFSRLMDPQLNAPGTWVMNPVKRLPDGSLAVEATSDTTLVITLSQPFPAFAGLLTMQYTAVVPFEAIECYGENFRKNPVGTGPFRFQYWKEGVKLVLLKNEHYFEYDGDQRLPFLDAVAISFIIDRQTAFLEFIKGNLDFLSSVDASYKDEILTPEGRLQPRYAGRYKMISKPFLNTEYLGILVDEQSLPADWPLREAKVRQAINLGFDREKMIRYLRNNIGIPAHAGFIPVGMPGFPTNEGGYSYDPDRARQLLAEAGFPGGQGLPRLTLHTNQNYLDISQFIQHELSKIGIAVAIDVMPPATLREMMAKGEARMFRASWIADYPDAENYLALFYSKNHAPDGPNYTRFTDARFDRLYEQSLAITSDSLRQALYREMDQILIEKAPVVFLFYDQSVRFVPVSMEGMTNNPLNHLDLRRARFQ